MAGVELRPDDFDAVADPHIPTLATVLGPASMVEHLRRVLPDRCDSVRHIGIHILKRHRTRCTFEIEWPGENTMHAVIGKVFAADRNDVYDAMQAIQRAGFGPRAAYSIPTALAYVPELRLLLLEKVQGPRVKQVLLTGAERARIEASERCAHWLLRFQAAAPRLGEWYGIDHVLGSLHEWSQPYAAGGVLADKALRLRVLLEAAASGLPATEPCASHGEYTCGQVLLSSLPEASSMASPSTSTGAEMKASDRTVACDWDGYNVADPCRDAACFFVDLVRVASKNPDAAAALHEAAAVFIETYLLHAGQKVAHNLPFYAAARCLRLARKDSGRGLADRAEFMLDAGLRFREQGCRLGGS
jgi:hypothetical protein